MRPRLFVPTFSLALAAVALSSLVACSTSPAPTQRGEATGAPVAPSEIAQSDVNRMATLAMADNLQSLYRLMDKLYRRNPAEWRKTSPAGRDAAIAEVRRAIESRSPWPALEGKRDIAALSLAMSADFRGDRVAAFIHASADMLVTAHGGRTEFYLTDTLDAQYIYNAARNIESAAWLLSSRKSAAGQPLLLADEINERERNLSFEREFGKLVGRLDLLSEVVTEKYRRAVISYAQNLVGGAFFQFLPVR
ncbi:MAG: hypothetical protein EOO28_04885 [Comamonadaceae bacterium]|nr:MAG: hypothetical protein EOO28_04885 [Comamonadaceae bacterium]